MVEGKTRFHLGSKFGFKGLIIVAAVAIIHQWYIMEFPDDEDLTIATFSYGFSSLIVAFAAFFIGKRYWGSEVFGRTYISLAIGFLLLFIGDMTYIYYDWFTEEAPYPSLADVFFLLSYPFLAYHLVRNIKYFKKDLKWSPKIGVAALTVAIVGIFAIWSFEMIEEEPFDFYFGLLFVFASAVVVSLAILGAAVFRHSILGSAWLLLAGGIFIFTVADVWYYHLELVEGYTGDHFVNTLWVLSNAAMVYALYKHKKTI